MIEDLLNFLETTSLEPHDDYKSEFTYKEQKELYKYIKELQKENEECKKDNKRLGKEQIEYLTEFGKMQSSQDKFIKYLEDEIEQNTPNVRWKHYNEDGFNDYDVENPSCIEMRPPNMILEEILQKYKEIVNGTEQN